MSSIDISDLGIDHLVLNVDAKYQINEKEIETIKEVGLPYEPQKGKGTSGFKASDLWIGNQYLEMVRILKSDGGGWIPEWTQRYLEGKRGLVCLFLDTDDISALYSKLNNKNMTSPERIKYKLFFGLLSMSPPWENAYLPYFEGVPFQIGFQKINSEKDKERLYKRMIPNSRENGITGISHIEIYGTFTDIDFKNISELSTTISSSEKDSLIWNLKNNQSITFIKAEEYHIKIYLKNDTKENTQKSVRIENVELIIE